MKKILIVEDNELQTFLLEETLDNRKYRISSVNDSLSAIEKVKNISPDLLILDIVMKNKSGFDILGEVSKAIPCVMVISSIPSAYGKNKALSLGAKYYFEKPIDIYQIKDVIDEELAYIN